MKRLRLLTGILLCCVLFAAVVPTAVQAADSGVVVYHLVGPTQFSNTSAVSLSVQGTNFQTVTQVMLGTIQLPFTLGGTITDAALQTWETMTIHVPEGIPTGTYTLSMTNGFGAAGYADPIEVLPGPYSLRSDGPFGGVIRQIMTDPVNPWRLYAVAHRVGIFRSDDRGNHWKYMFSGIGWEGTMAMDGVNSNVLYATRMSDGLYRSDDAGTSWTRIPLPGINQVYSVRAFPHPTVSGTVFAALGYADISECGTACGIYRSTNFGATWERVSATIPNEQYMLAMAFLPSNPSVIFAGTGDGSIFRSTDNGSTWTFQDKPSSHISQLVFRTADTLFVVGSGEGSSLPLLRCAVASNELNCRDSYGYPNYVPINKDTPFDPSDGNQHVIDLKVNPRDSQDLLVSAGWKVARSKDGGANWQYYSHPSSLAQPGAVSFDAQSPALLYQGSSLGLWKSTGGEEADFSLVTWSEFDYGLNGVVPTSILVAPSDPLTVYTNTQSGQFRSQDGGKSWLRLPLFCDSPEWCYTLNTPMAIDRRNANRLLIATWQNTFKISQDGGMTWPVETARLLNPAGWPETYQMGFHTILSMDGDGTETQYLAGGSFFNPMEPNAWISAGGGIYRSVDSGASWSLAWSSNTHGPVTSIAADPTTPGRVYATTCTLDTQGYCVHGRVLISNDSGQTWGVLTPDDPIFNYYVHRLVTVRPSDGRVFLDNFAGVCWKDKNSDTWTVGNESLPPFTPTNDMVFTAGLPAIPEALYVANNQGFFKSVDGGQTFVRFDGPLGAMDTTAIGVGRYTDGSFRLYVGIAGGQFSLMGAASGLQAQPGEQLVEAGIYPFYIHTERLFIPMIRR